MLMSIDLYTDIENVNSGPTLDDFPDNLTPYGFLSILTQWSHLFSGNCSITMMMRRTWGNRLSLLVPVAPIFSVATGTEDLPQSSPLQLDQLSIESKVTSSCSPSHVGSRKVARQLQWHTAPWWTREKTNTMRLHHIGMATGSLFFLSKSNFSWFQILVTRAVNLFLIMFLFSLKVTAFCHGVCENRWLYLWLKER